MSTISLNNLSFEFEAEESCDYPEQLHTLSGSAIDPVHGLVATLRGYCIYREHLEGDFLAMMDDESQELHEFSVALFDRDGMIKPHLKNGFRSGSKCWGDELNEGTLIYLEDITVGEKVNHESVYLCYGLLSLPTSIDDWALARTCCRNFSRANMSHTPITSCAFLCLGVGIRFPFFAQ